MSPSHEEESLMKVFTGEEVIPSSEEYSRRSNERSSRRNLSQKSPTKSTSAGKSQPAKQTNLKSVTTSVKSSVQSLASAGRQSEREAGKQNVIAKNAPINKQKQVVGTMAKQTSPAEMEKADKWEVEREVVETTQLQVEEGDEGSESDRIVVAETTQSRLKVQKCTDSPVASKDPIREESEEQSNESLSAQKSPERENEPRTEPQPSKFAERAVFNETFQASHATSTIRSNDNSMTMENDSELQTAVKALNIKIFLVFKSLLYSSNHSIDRLFEVF